MTQLELTDGSSPDTVDSTESLGPWCCDCGRKLRQFDPDWWWCDRCMNGTTDQAVQTYPEYWKEQDMPARKRKTPAKKPVTRKAQTGKAEAPKNTKLKVGVAATKRLAVVKKEKGAAEAKKIEAKAQEIAAAAGMRMVKVEQILEAEGVKVTDELVREYRGKGNGSGKDGAAPAAGRARADKTEKKPTRTRSGGSRKKSRRKTETGSGPSASNGTAKTKSQQDREQREANAAAREKAAAEAKTPPEPSSSEPEAAAASTGML